MEIVIFGRFQAKAGREAEMEDALRAVQAPTRAEPGCLELHLYRSVKDPRLYYVHSRWRDMASFERHAEMPHTLRMLERVEPLLVHPLDVTRSTLVS
jgi:quinol monooxygenase YgiN